MSDYDLGTARGKIEVDGSGAVAGIKSVETAQHSLGKSSMSTSAAMAVTGTAMVGVGAAAVAGFGVAINAAANFEQGLSNIEAVSGATEKQMEAIRKKALRLGADTQFSAGEAASAMEELVKAGLSVEDVVNGAADATVNLAAAGEVSLPEAAEIAAAAMNNFGLSAETMPRVADLIAGAANASAISVSDFGQSLKQSGAVASLVGLSFDDLSLAITAMGNAGIKGSDAGTSLKTFLSNLQPTTEKQANLMGKLGIVTEEAGNRFFDAEGNIKSMAEISDVLSGALEGMTSAQQQMALETLFGSDAIRAAAIIAKEGGEGFNELAVQMGKVKAADVAATKMDNFNGSVEQLKGSIETLLIQIGTPFLGVLRDVVDRVTEVVNWIGNLNPQVQKLAAMVTLGTGALVGLVGGILLAVSAFQKVREVLTALQLGAFLTNPIFLVIAAIAALVAGLVILYQRSEAFRNIVNEVGSTIMSVLQPAIQSVIAFAQNFVTQLQNAWDVLRSGDDVAQGLGETLDSAFGGSGFLIAPIRSFVTYVMEHWRKIVAFTEEIWPQVSEAIEHILNVIHDIVGIVLDTVAALWRAWGDDIWRMVKATFELVKESVENAIKLVQNIIRTVLAVINGDWGKAWDGIKNILSTIWNQIFTVIDYTLSIVRSLIGGFLSTIQQVWAAIWNWLYDTVVGRIADMIESVRGIPGKITDALSGLPAQMVEIGKAIIEGLWNGILSMKDWLIEKANEIGEWVRNPVQKVLELASPSRLFFEFGVNTIQGFIDGVEDKEQSLQDSLRDMFESAVAGVNTILSSIGALEGNADAHVDVAEAEAELARLRERSTALPDEIAAAEERLRRTRRAAARTTVEEERRIIEARQRVTEAEKALQEAQRTRGISADDLRLKEIALTQAEQALTAARQAANEQVSPQVEAAERRLSELREEAKTITDELKDATRNLERAQMRVVESELRLVDVGQDLIDIGPESEEMFIMLADRAGWTAEKIMTLVWWYAELRNGIRAANEEAAKAVGKAKTVLNATSATTSSASRSASSNAKAIVENKTTINNIDKVEIEVKELDEIKTVQDFFNRIEQTARQGG